MPWVGFETTMPAFEQAETVHALNPATTVIGKVKDKLKYKMNRILGWCLICKRFYEVWIPLDFPDVRTVSFSGRIHQLQNHKWKNSPFLFSHIFRWSILMLCSHLHICISCDSSAGDICVKIHKHFLSPQPNYMSFNHSLSEFATPRKLRVQVYIAEYPVMQDEDFMANTCNEPSTCLNI
jgi:hypothetical protein